MTDLVEGTDAFEATFKSDAGNGKVGILQHGERLVDAVKVKHLFKIHMHMPVEGAGEILIIISLSACIIC